MLSGTKTILSIVMVSKGYKAHLSSLRYPRLDHHLEQWKEEDEGSEKGCTHCRCNALNFFILNL